MPTTTRSSIPEHVAIIMDGNGRWAKQRGLPRVMGHRRGVEAVRETVRAAGDCGIRYLTLFAFSSENWRRPESEVSDLMGLLKAFIRRDLAELHRENVRVRIIGDRQGLKTDIRSLLEEAEQMTAGNTKLTLVIAFNYGSRDEIARATVAIARDVAEGRLDAASITPEMISARLDTSGMPDPDLSSAPAAKSARRTSCSGRPLILSSSSFPNIGPTSTASDSSPQSSNMQRVTAALVHSPSRLPWQAPDEP